MAKKLDLHKLETYDEFESYAENHPECRGIRNCKGSHVVVKGPFGAATIHRNGGRTNKPLPKGTRKSFIRRFAEIGLVGFALFISFSVMINVMVR